MVQSIWVMGFDSGFVSGLSSGPGSRITRGHGKGRRIGHCWVKYVQPIKGCGAEIEGSHKSGKILVEGKCCGVILSLTQYCFNQIFSTPPFTTDFGALLQIFCRDAD
ncbi:unnamed protein product [Amaranthus hypochondriacus]